MLNLIIYQYLINHFFHNKIIKKLNYKICKLNYKSLKHNYKVKRVIEYHSNNKSTHLPQLKMTKIITRKNLTKHYNNFLNQTKSLKDFKLFITNFFRSLMKLNRNLIHSIKLINNLQHKMDNSAMKLIILKNKIMP